MSEENNEQTGFAVLFKTDCPHIDEAFKLSPEMIPSIHSPCEFDGCGDDKENWVCVTCGKVGCSRYRPGKHMVAHVENEKHTCLMSFSDLSTWCTECQEYVAINGHEVEALKLTLYVEKFGKMPPNQFHLADSFVEGDKPSSTQIDPLGVGDDEDTKEYEESDDELAAHAKEFAEKIRNSDHCVVYTGAGISTSAGCPDYRGPKGKWTLQAKGKQCKGVNIRTLDPTPTHMAIRKLLQEGLVSHVVSTNTEGLHRRSGIDVDGISELHGNAFKYVCDSCGDEMITDYHLAKSPYSRHGTDVQCKVCDKGEYCDSIIHFGENLPEDQLENAVNHSEQCDLALVLGTSMRVSPACQLPFYGPKNQSVCLVNMQKTPYDEHEKMETRVFSKTDAFMELVMKELGIEIPEWEGDEELAWNDDLKKKSTSAN